MAEAQGGCHITKMSKNSQSKHYKLKDKKECATLKNDRTFNKQAPYNSVTSPVTTSCTLYTQGNRQ